MNQNKYLELQMLSSEIQQIQQQMQSVDKQIVELQRLEETLTDLSKTKPGTESLSALGSGIFVKSKIENTKEVVMAVGANISVTKPVEDAKKVITNQLSETEKALKELEKAISERMVKAQMLQQELQSEAKKKRK